MYELNAYEFLASDFAGRIRLVNRICGLRLSSFQLAAIWVDTIEQAAIHMPDRSPAIRQLVREAMSLGPELSVAERCYDIFVDGVREQQASGPPKIVHLVISCRKYIERATKLYSHLSTTLQPLFVVIGDPMLIDASMQGEFLSVPAPDGYEALPKKVLEAFLAVRRIFGAVAVLKIDDDAQMGGAPDARAIDDLLASVQYAGIPAGHAGLDRCWHVGKCEENGDLPYMKRLHGPWANGSLYYVGPNALDRIVRDYLFFPDEILGELFEDKLVGDILRTHAIPLTPMDLAPTFGIDLYQEREDELPAITINWRKP